MRYLLVRFFVFVAILFHDVLQPDCFLYKDKSNYTFYNIRKMYHDQNVNYMQSGEVSKDICKRYTDATDKNTVKDECDDGSSSGA